MQILDSESDQHHRMDEQTKVNSDSPEGKCIEQSTDDDIINDDAEPNILEQSQVTFVTFVNYASKNVYEYCTLYCIFLFNVNFLLQMIICFLIIR